MGTVSGKAGTGSILMAWWMLGSAAAAHQLQTCNVNDDAGIDLADIELILAARNTPSSGPGDPRDADGDGVITVLDARRCVTQCTLPRCALVAPDTTAPDPPEIMEVTSPTSQPLQALIGTAEPNSIIQVSGGSSPASIQTFGTGLFMLNVFLKPNAINRLLVTASDKAGNTSAPTGLTIVQSDSLPPPQSGQPARISISSGNYQAGITNQQLPQPLVVIVTDPDGAPVSGQQVSWHSILGGAVFGGQPTLTTQTDVEGRSSASLTLGPDPILHMVQANFAGNQSMAAEFAAEGLRPRPGQKASLRGVVMTPDFRAIPGVRLVFFGTGINDGVVLTTSSDQDGDFSFPDVPPGNNQMLEVQGSTALLEEDFPDLHFDIDVLPGQDNKTGRRNGRGKPLFLPPLNAGQEVLLDSEGFVLEAAEARFDSGQGLEPIIVQIPLGTRITLPPGAQPRISITGVPINRIPMPLPDGMVSNTVITVQPSGATFEPPLPISLPNLDGAPPGTRLRLLSFSLAAGDFVDVGTATVSPDGIRIESDPGAGIREGAWHATPPQATLDQLLSMICTTVQIPANAAGLECECWYSNSSPGTPVTDQPITNMAFCGLVIMNDSSITGIENSENAECVCTATITIEITSPSDGATVPSSNLVVSGTVEGITSDVTVQVGGQSATATPDINGNWQTDPFMGLAEGEVLVSATSPTGQPSNPTSVGDSITVTLTSSSTSLQHEGKPKAK